MRVSTTIIYACTFLIFQLTIAAQGIDTLWTKLYGTNDYDSGWDIKHTSTNNYIIVGDKGVGPSNNYIWLLKIDLNGDTIWTRTFEEGKLGRSIGETSDSGFIITGSTEYWGSADSDLLLLKTDINGNTFWTKMINTGGLEHGESVKETNDGSFIIGGTYDQNSPAIRMSLVVKTDSEGNKLWDKKYGSTLYMTQCLKMELATNQEIFLTGVTNIDGTGAGDLFLKKLSPNGDEIWETVISDYFYSVGFDLELTPNDDILVCGGKEDASGGLINALILKFDQNGNEIWRKIYDDYPRSNFLSIVSAQENYYLLTGWATVSSSLELLIAKINEQGDSIFNSTFLDNSSTLGSSISYDSNGMFAVTGYSSYGTNFYDVLVAAFLDEISNLETHYNLTLAKYVLEQNYPNPFNPVTRISYQIPTLSFVTLKVFDVLGNEIATLVDEEQVAGGYVVHFNANARTSGIYFYRLQAGSFVETKKMVLIQ